jgi:threonine/homoserine/homoserine lactone efflux protein
MVIIEGIGTGLLLSLFIGPSFFYLIKISLIKGWFAAIRFALGIMLSDVILIGFINMGLSSLLENLMIQQVFAFFAGSIILVMGILSVWVPSKAVKTEEVTTTGSQLSFVVKGFSINFFNPFTIGVWVGVLGTLQMSYSKTDNLEFFLATVVFTILLMDIAKAYSASYLSRKINDALLVKINRGLGAIFIILGLRLYWFLIETL